MRTVIVLPTYNEAENIIPVLDLILKQNSKVDGSDINVLVVDDSSPDGTGNLVTDYSKQHSNVYLLTRTKKEGLGKAYIAGFQYAINVLKADILFEMDADLSHNPDDIPRFIQEILNGNDFVIGSRYVEGGSIPADWPPIRKLNSIIGNGVARYIAGIYKVQDCTSGYRAIRADVIKNIDLNALGVKGYSFQMNLLYAAYVKKFKIKEIPIQFTDRLHGKSKLKFSDIREFIFNAFLLRFPKLRVLKRLVLSSLIVVPIPYFVRDINPTEFPQLLIIFLVSVSTLMAVQGGFNLFLTLYAWEDIQRAIKDRSPELYAEPRFSFTALVPARHEKAVIAETINTIYQMDYPKELMEIIVICRIDDTETIEAVRQAISSINDSNVKLVIFEDMPINKPHGLNIGLLHATKEIVAIFDAEDSPHKELYNIINTVLIKEDVDIVQSGVQLMNYDSTWFSAQNVLEYYFWFKSSLHYFSKQDIVPLGGNTVFFKRHWLEKVGGWDEQCLTEDADIGIRLSLMQAKIRVIYDERHVTKEETPPTLTSFIKQRTRWNQGFFQIFRKGDWLKLRGVKKKILIAYVLMLPIVQSIFLLLIPISIFLAFFIKIPVIFALMSFFSVISPIYTNGCI
jgi:glycosyltransferase XagB